MFVQKQSKTFFKSSYLNLNKFFTLHRCFFFFFLFLLGFLQLSDGLHVWDLSGGQSHSLLLADSDCVQPVLLYCGQQQQPLPVKTAMLRSLSSCQRSPNRAESYTVRPTQLCLDIEVCGPKLKILADSEEDDGWSFFPQREKSSYIPLQPL